METPPEGSSRLSAVADIVIAAGLGLLAAGVVLAPYISGGGAEAEVRALRVSVAILCVITAVLWLLVRRAGRDLRRMDELLTDVRFGSGTRRDRDAVDILVRALGTPDARARETALRTLRKISGLELGPDPGPWEQWWAAARPTFVRSGAPPEKAASGPSPGKGAPRKK